MVSVRVTSKGKNRALEMSGHACCAEKGQPDLVCAGCSAVIYSLLGFMENHPESFRALSPRRVFPGEVLLAVSSEGEAFDAAFETAVIGLLQIEKTAPKGVRVLRGDFPFP